MLELRRLQLKNEFNSVTIVKYLVKPLWFNPAGSQASHSRNQDRSLRST